jgi:putative hydrolase of the HAD superfamily
MPAPSPRPYRPRAGPAWPKVVLFDLDDTLFDHDHACRSGIARVRRGYARWGGHAAPQLYAEYSRQLEALHPKVLAGVLSTAEARLERFHGLARWCGFEIDRSEAAGFAQQYRQQYLRARRAVPGARAVLERLHGRVTIGVVTNNRVEDQHDKIRAIGIDRRIDFLVISEAVGCSKPDPRIFRIALAEAGAEAEEAAMIGDSWVSDVMGARGAGIPAIWFNRLHQRAPEPVDVPTIESYAPIGTLTRLLARGA